ncbi:transposase [Sphingobium sp.]|uniref:transposase n=1 Tax=Sphingobium sp. TaxID=1912891 RepID=UPI0039B84B2E
MDVIPAGPARRRWSAEAKARIIASSFEPGANIAETARTHGLVPQQLYAWRHVKADSQPLPESRRVSEVPALNTG